MTKVIKQSILIHLLLLGLFNGLQSQSGIFSGLDLLQGKSKVSIPFKFVNNFIILDVNIFGTIPVSLIFDTGAEHVILFKREYTDILQVSYDKRIPIMGSDLSRQIYALITRNAVLEIPNLPPTSFDILVLEEDYFNLEELIGTSIDGLIGGGFFKNLVVQIDYRNLQLTLHDPAGFKIPHGFTILPIKIKINKPYIDAAACLQDGSVVQVDLLIDTGASVPLLLHTNSHPSLKLPDRSIRGKLGMGLGGYLEGFIGRINKLTVGEIDFPGIITSFQDIKTEFLANKDRFRNGILGNQLLSRFMVYFDYNRGQLLLKARKSKNKPFEMDKSGLVIFAYGNDFNQFIINDIIRDSPASESDVLPGDELVQLQGMPASFYSLQSINTILQKKAGKRIRLVVRRDGKNLKRHFYLRDLI